MSELERIVWVSPAYDKRNPDPSKDYGIGACRITFVLKGPLGAVQFMIGTNWYLPHVQRDNREWQHSHDTRFDSIQPEGWDIGYHSPTPRYEGQEPLKHDCELVDGGTCYYDGSGLQASEMIPDFIAGGTAWLWPELERRYRDLFCQESAHAPDHG